MTIREALQKYNTLEVDLLLAHVLKKSREFLYLHGEHRLTQIQQNRLTQMVKRREKGEPIAYILGYKDFFGLRFKVNKDVLIPRPETEWIVERVRSYELEVMNGKPVKILDVGTGSGAIAISLAKNLPAKICKIFASDISPAALKVAKQNAKTLYYDTSKYHSKIQFVQSDLFKNIEGKFDVITANLPYVPLKMLHKHLLHPTSLKLRWTSKTDPLLDPFIGLKFEPPFALTDGTSSWQIYRRFFQEVKNHVNPGAVIILEIDPAQKKELPEIIKRHLPHSTVKFHKDFRSLWRFVEIELKD